MINYNVVGETEDGQIKINFTDSEFSDIILSIGGIEFIEGDDEANMKFDYNIHEGVVPEDRFEEFRALMGDFIIQAIEEGIKRNDLIYTGGTDENRNNNTEQSDI